MSVWPGTAIAAALFAVGGWDETARIAPPGPCMILELGYLYLFGLIDRGLNAT
jgi:hypothetical protein